MTDSSRGMHVFSSELGWMALVWDGQQVTRLTFGHPSRAAAMASLEADGVACEMEGGALPNWVVELADRLMSYAAGADERFEDVRIEMSHLSEFQRRVVRACRRIGRGRVRTYGELASAAGAPGAARAVGSVMAKNRYPIIVPCHRVVGSGGTLGGFSARDGVRMKLRMLDLEGVELSGTKRENNLRPKLAMSGSR